MTGQLRAIDEILMDRLRIVQAIAEANTVQLRLNQKASGMMVLEMKDDLDGKNCAVRIDGKTQLDTDLAENLDKIHQLEDQLSSLDEELATAMEEKT
ncbi:MAG: hypothetical protein ACPGNV_06390 [Mangrovicoccus sp.]